MPVCCRLSLRRVCLSLGLIALWAAYAPPSVAAQSGTGPITSSVARVQISATVLPRAVPASVPVPRPITWNNATGEGFATVTLSVNTPYRLVAQLLRDPAHPGSPPQPAVWVQAGTGSLRELEPSRPVTVDRGAGSDGSVRVRIRLLQADGGPQAVTELPVRFDLVMEPTP